MSPVFDRRGQLIVKLCVLAVALTSAAALALAMSKTRAFAAIGEPAAQPIPFSHKHHVGDDGIDCRYCHTTVETAAFAGLPSTATCLTCHSQLYVDAPILAPLHRSQAEHRPIAWTLLHKLPDFVYFDHSIHVAKGVGCVECHGRVDQMPLEWRSAPLLMEWCLDCHRDPAPHLRPREQVFATTPTSPALARSLHVPLQNTRRLTDCSTCHR
jgi:hypothetical protein